MLLFVALLAFNHCKAQNLWGPASQDVRLDGKVRKIHVIYRHGHREPIHNYPNDPHTNSDVWMNGPGQLTILGRQHAYQLGRNLRSRYNFMVPEERAWKAVEAISSNVSRTLMSSAAVLAGMIPPEDQDRWSFIDWQPAAVFTDGMLSARPLCPRYDYLRKHNRIKPNEDSKKLYDYVARHSGESVTNPIILLNIHNCLEIEQQAGLVLPVWTYPVLRDVKREATKAYLQSPEITRLQIGPLLKAVSSFNISNIGHAITLYCTHDTLIGGLLGGLRFNITEPPNFASAIIIEFREVRRRFHAQLWYRIGPNDELIRLPWPNCGIRCPVTKLKEILDPLMTYDRVRECMMFGDDKNLASSENFIFTVIVLVSLGGMFIISGHGRLIHKLIK